METIHEFQVICQQTKVSHFFNTWEQGTWEEWEIWDAYYFINYLSALHGRPWNCNTSQLHSWSTRISQEDPIWRQTLPSRSDELQSQRQNLNAHSVKNTSLVGHHPQAFHVSILHSPEWALSSLPTELANSQTSAFKLFKKFTDPFSGLVIWEEQSLGRSPWGDRPVQRAAAKTAGPPSLAHTWVEQSNQAPQRGAPSLPAVWLQDVLFYKSESTESDRHSDDNSMGWLRINLHKVKIGRYQTPSLYIWYCCLPFTNGTLTHSNLAHLQLTCNQHDKTPQPTSLQSIPPLTHSLPHILQQDHNPYSNGCTTRTPH